MDRSELHLQRLRVRTQEVFEVDLSLSQADRELFRKDPEAVITRLITEQVGTPVNHMYISGDKQKFIEDTIAKIEGRSPPMGEECHWRIYHITDPPDEASHW